MNDGIPLTIFLDNLRVHHSKIVQKMFADLKIECIFNVPYTPENNPIEYFFSTLKCRYKKMRLEQMIQRKQKSSRKIIEECLINSNKEMI